MAKSLSTLQKHNIYFQFSKFCLLFLQIWEKKAARREKIERKNSYPWRITRKKKNRKSKGNDEANQTVNSQSDKYDDLKPATVTVKTEHQIDDTTKQSVHKQEQPLLNGTINGEEHAKPTFENPQLSTSGKVNDKAKNYSKMSVQDQEHLQNGNQSGVEDLTQSLQAT